MKINCIIGIDPGVCGGLAIYRPGEITKVIKMPRDLFELQDYFKHMNDICKPIVFLEKVQLRPDDVSADSPGKAFRIQKLLNEFEKLKNIMTMCDIPYILVHPQKWQNTLKLKIKNEEKKDRKNRYKDIAGDLYPNIKTTLWNADALLIMHFGRYVLQSKTDWVMENLPKNMHNKLF